MLCQVSTRHCVLNEENLSHREQYYSERHSREGGNPDLDKRFVHSIPVENCSELDNRYPAVVVHKELDHPVKSQRDPADRMMTVAVDEIAAPSFLDGSQ
jgi:hypothetical protein